MIKLRMFLNLFVLLDEVLRKILEEVENKVRKEK